MNKVDYTSGNKDDINTAVKALSTFTRNWCMDCAETEAKGEPMFRCHECPFNTKAACLVKIFNRDHADARSPFGCMDNEVTYGDIFYLFKIYFAECRVEDYRPFGFNKICVFTDQLRSLDKCMTVEYAGCNKLVVESIDISTYRKEVDLE